MSEVGFEPTPPFGDQNTQRKLALESGALDHSAILTIYSGKYLQIKFDGTNKGNVDKFSIV